MLPYQLRVMQVFFVVELFVKIRATHGGSSMLGGGLDHMYECRFTKCYGTSSVCTSVV